MTTRALVVTMPDQVYLARLRALGAWWCLGSSRLDPRLLMQFALAAPAAE